MEALGRALEGVAPTAGEGVLPPPTEGVEEALAVGARPVGVGTGEVLAVVHWEELGEALVVGEPLAVEGALAVPPPPASGERGEAVGLTEALPGGGLGEVLLEAPKPLEGVGAGGVGETLRDPAMGEAVLARTGVREPWREDETEGEGD